MEVHTPSQQQRLRNQQQRLRSQQQRLRGQQQRLRGQHLPLHTVIALAFVIGVGLILSGALPVKADPAIIYVRTDGDDTACNGEYDAPASFAPNCAVQSIRQGVNVVSPGGTVNVRAGTYTENLCIDKSIQLIGTAAVTLTSQIGLNQSLINLRAHNVTIDGFTLLINRPYATAGIHAREIDGLTVRNSTIRDSGSHGWFDNPFLFTNVVGIAVLSDDETPESVIITNTHITLTTGVTSFYNRGIWLRKVYGEISDNTLHALEQDALIQYPFGGETLIHGNHFTGAGVSIKEPVNGPVTISANIFAPTSDTFPQSLLIKHNYIPVPIHVTNNTFTGHRVGILSGASRDVNVHNNTFVPAAEATVFTHTQINTAYPSSAPQDPLGGANAITLTNNIFQNSTASGLHGTAIEIKNDNSKNAVDFDSITIGGSPSATNIFGVGLKRTVWLKSNVTRTNPNINALWNNWGYSTVEEIEERTYHQPDDSNLAKVDFYDMIISADPTTQWADGSSTIEVTGGITGFLTPGAGNTISFTTDFGTLFPPAALTNASAQAQATLTSTTAGTTTLTAIGGGGSNNIVTATTNAILLPITDLVISKSDDETTVAPGDTLAYMITITNTGYHTAAGIILTDTLPAETTFIIASDGGALSDRDDNTVVWPSFDVYDNGVPVTRLVVVRLNNPLPPGIDMITNTAQIHHFLDSDPTNNIARDVNTVSAAPDLMISKNDGGFILYPGDTINYNLTYANIGDQIATGVIISETVPLHTTFNAAASSPGWDCADNAPGGTVCTYTIGELGVTGNHNVIFATKILAPLPAGVTQIDNAAIISDDGTNGADPNTANNTTADFTPVSTVVDLAISKSDGAINAATDETVVYTLTCANMGNQVVSGVIVTEIVPAYTVFDAMASTPGWSCADGALPGTVCLYTIDEVADVDILTYAVKIDATLPAGVTQIDNTTYISDDGTNGLDINLSNNSDTDHTPVGAAADLAVSKTDGRSIVYPEQQLTYNIAITNQGVQGATNVLITDTLPATVIFESASDAGVETAPGSGIIVWPTIDQLPSGVSLMRTVRATVISTLPAGVNYITNTVSITDDGLNGPDANPENNTAIDVDFISVAPDLILTKTTSSLIAYPGSMVSYTITIDNIGQQDSRGVAIIDQSPIGTTFVSASDGATETVPGYIVWPVFNLSAGERATRTLVLRIQGIVAGKTVTNTASVTDDGSSGTDPTPENNIDIAATYIERRSIYLPMILKNYAVGPDIVVESITVQDGVISIVIKNQGLRPVPDVLGFWVDLYINPEPIPTHVNQIWPMLSANGAAWGVSGGALPINPGQTRTLSIYDPYFSYEYSDLPSTLAAGDLIYVQVDSVNSATTYGSILEDHEMINKPYNNISFITITETQSIAPPPTPETQRSNVAPINPPGILPGRAHPR